jgi:diacylglycerol kinase (ATP)
MSLKKRIHSFKYAFAGIKELFRAQPNARIHLTIALLVLIAGRYFNISTIEWTLLSICIALVLSMEAMNTAVEYLTDLVSPDYHPLAGKAKDVAAAAVLFCAIGAIIVGLLIFAPKILILF